MSHIAPIARCLCDAGPALPRTLAEFGPCDALGTGLDTLALAGTQLTDGLISTNNGAALLSGRGGYGAYQDSTMPFRPSRRRIMLRIDPMAAPQLALSHAKPDGGRVMMVADSRGVISHRVETRHAADVLVLGSISGADGPHRPDLETQDLPAGVVPLGAVRKARSLWHKADTGAHLNDLFERGGRQRHGSLPYLGRERAWPVSGHILTRFLTYLNDRGPSYVRMVPGAGLIQGQIAGQEAMRLAGQVLIFGATAGDGGRCFALDLAQVGSVWVTCFGGLSQLELYDPDGRAVAVLAADPGQDMQAWNGLVASLPRKSSGA